MAKKTPAPIVVPPEPAIPPVEVTAEQLKAVADAGFDVVGLVQPVIPLEPIPPVAPALEPAGGALVPEPVAAELRELFASRTFKEIEAAGQLTHAEVEEIEAAEQSHLDLLTRPTGFVPVRLLKHVEGYNAGEVVGFEPAVAKKLIADGYAAPYQE